MNTMPIALIASLSALIATSACSGSDDPDSRSRIDARAYFEDYRSGSADGGGVAYSGTVAAEDSAQGPSRTEPVPPSEPGLLDDNTFADAGTHGFVDTRADNLSTFALDVDTGSYAVGRMLLSEGLLPPPDSIRPEEWVNAYEYDDDAAVDSDLSISVDQGLSPSTDDGTQVVRVGMSARDITDEERPPVALTLVVDTSGSMDIRERLGLVQSSLALLAKHLQPTDTVAVVTYENNATPVLEPTPVRNSDKILDAIDDLRPGGSTNLEAGLRLGYQLARDAYRDDAINTVVLASDGVANVGVTGPDSLATMIREQGAEGIHLVTVGYGMGNYNDDLMEQLADQGDGFYSYVDTFEEAQRLFRDELTSTLTPVAYDAKIQVEFDPELVSSYRLIGYENRDITDEDFDNAQVDAGEIGAGHEVTALYEVRFTDAATAGAEIGTATVRWESASTSSLEEQGIALTAAGPESEMSDELLLAATVADLAQVLKGAEALTERGVGLDDLAVRAEVLQDRGVEGAAELAHLIALAQQAH